MQYPGHPIEIDGQILWSTAEDPVLAKISKDANVDPKRVKKRAEMLASVIAGVSLSDLKNDPALRKALRELF